MSNETLEDAAKKQWGNVHRIGVLAFKDGAKWQAERMYSEEDLREAFSQGEDNMDYSDNYGWTSKQTVQQWFEQFKKK